MSKKIYTIAAAALLLFGVTSCTTLNQALSTGNTGTAIAAGGNILDNLLGSVLGSQPITERELVGRWGYTGVSTVFESQNFLAQAGGVAAAGVLEAKLDENLTRFGFKKGSTTFVFNADHTFEANLNGMPISGTYTLEPNKKVLHLSLLGGLMNFHPQVVRTASGISILFDSDKLLSLLGAASKIAGSDVGVELVTDEDGFLWSHTHLAQGAAYCKWKGLHRMVDDLTLKLTSRPDDFS